jgi:hypothetical protein
MREKQITFLKNIYYLKLKNDFIITAVNLLNLQILTLPSSEQEASVSISLWFQAT